MNEVTIVTALYNLNRTDRSWNDYLKWFDKTLKLKCPMFIFTTEDVRNFIEERRKEIPTEIRIHSIEEIPYYHLKDRITEVINSDYFKQNIDCPERIECTEPLYSIIQFSKFWWLREAVKNNVFDSEFFFWMDAGASRFFEGFDLNNKFPSDDAIESLKEMGEKILLQLNMEYYPNLAQATTLDEQYLCDSRAITCGSFFGGHKNKIQKLGRLVYKVLNNMLNAELINNEQIVLAYLLKQYPEEFIAYERTNGKHMDLFTELS